MLSQNSFLTGQLSAPCWFVGAMTGGADQTNRFIDEGLWEHDFDDNSRMLAQARSMQTGERIAIKAAYSNKQNQQTTRRPSMGSTPPQAPAAALGAVPPQPLLRRTSCLAGGPTPMGALPCHAEVLRSALLWLAGEEAAAEEAGSIEGA